MDKRKLSTEIQMLAKANSIDMLGYCTAEEFSGYRLNNSMRADPKRTLPEAKTIIIAGLYIGGVVLPSWERPELGRTSRLYLSGFFNDVVKQIEPIAILLQDEGYQALICDDSRNNGSILPLKLAAIRAGFGWQGKNSLLVTRKFGSFLALGGILTDAELEATADEQVNRCKTCKKCQIACPMKALEKDFILNTKKCLSYLLQTDDLPIKARHMVGNRIQDCEICQEACPWNAIHLAHPLDTIMTRNFQKEVTQWENFFLLSHLSGLTEREYNVKLKFLNTGIPYSIFKRNISIINGR